MGFDRYEGDEDRELAHERRITRCRKWKLKVPRGSPIGDRIRAWCVVLESGCWEWQGKTNPGAYGRICISRAKGDAQAHRVAYEFFVGPAEGHKSRFGQHGGDSLRKRSLARWRQSVCLSRATAMSRMPARSRPRLSGKEKGDAMIVETEDDEYDPPRHVSHFATCPQSAQHRRAR